MEELEKKEKAQNKEKSKKQFYQYCKLDEKGHFETAFPENFFI